jgi:hypothetical protein
MQGKIEDLGLVGDIGTVHALLAFQQSTGVTVYDVYSTGQRLDASSTPSIYCNGHSSAFVRHGFGVGCILSTLKASLQRRSGDSYPKQSRPVYYMLLLAHLALRAPISQPCYNISPTVPEASPGIEEKSRKTNSCVEPFNLTVIFVHMPLELESARGDLFSAREGK